MTPHLDPPSSVAHIGTFPPTQCGLATFGAALVDAMTQHSPRTTFGIVDVVDHDRPCQHGVDLHWRQSDPASLMAAAEFVGHHDVALVEHEYGIYGGQDGDEIVRLLDRAGTPTVTVLHTVLDRPSLHQRLVVEQLGDLSEALVVMSTAAHDRLLSTYAVDPRLVHVIPHGAHPGTEACDHDRAGAATILTWGLLGPGKGIEAGIDAMAHLTSLIPAPRYVVAGETHPKVLARSGESYRRGLEARAERCGVDHLVHLDDSYRDVASLKRLIGSADVVLVPYETTEQVTSGVLVEAVAAGKPVVATDFPHARELLSDGAGIIVPHGDIPALAEALESVILHPRLAAQMRQRALELGAPMAWPAVGRRYLDVLRSAAELRTRWQHPMQVA